MRQLLQAAEGFQKVHKAQRGIKARKVVRQCLHSLASVGGVLRPPVLAPAAFVGFGASLVGMLAGKITGRQANILQAYFPPTGHHPMSCFAPLQRLPVLGGPGVACYSANVTAWAC